MRRAVFSRRNPRDEVDAAAPDALADDQGGDQVAPPVAAPANNNNNPA